MYYSQTGNTRAVAEQISSLLGAPTEEIVALNPYDGGFRETIERCLKEREAGILPEVKPLAANLDAYDVVFLGYPVWFGTYAPPVAAMLEQINLEGKTVVPFCTFGSGGLESSSIDLAVRQPGAKLLPGYGVRAARMAEMPKEIDRFLKSSGFIEGEYPVLDDFPVQHPVSEEEAAIFDAAVDGYPMLSASASTVASRSHPEGTEYLFHAVEKPRGGNDDMPPAGTIQVYVLAKDGVTPVFTRVVR